MKQLIFAFTLFTNVCAAQQNNIAQFAIWKQKPGQEQNFENGYKKHLEWHKTNADKWSWYGWYFSSGPRTGQFIDATFDHSWKDFDNSVKPVEDREDNKLHVYPFADLQTVFKTSLLSEASIADTNSLKSKFLRFITMDVAKIPDAVKLLQRLKIIYQAKNNGHFLSYKMADGGSINQVILLIGSESREEFGKTDNIQEEIAAIETAMKTKIIISISSEALNYLPAMSLFPE